MDLAGGTARRLIGGEPPLARPDRHPLSDSLGQPAGQVPNAKCITSSAIGSGSCHTGAHICPRTSTPVRRQPDAASFRRTLGASLADWRRFGDGKQVSDWHVKSLRKVKKALVEQTTSTELDVDQHIACHARVQREEFLSHAALHAKFANVAPDYFSPTFPLGNPLGAVLTRARGHALR